MSYDLHVKDLADNAVEVAAPDKQSLAVIRDEVKLHGYEVGPIVRAADEFRFDTKSDEPGKGREFLMGLGDVEVNG